MYLQLLTLLNKALNKSVLHIVIFSVSQVVLMGPDLYCLSEENFTEANENFVQIRSAS